MNVTAQEYASLKAFFAAVSPALMPLPASLPPEAAPMAVLEAIEGRSMANARRGLGMAIGDLFEQSEGVPAEWVAQTDAALAEAGLPTFSAVRARFDRAVRGSMRRGALRSEREYYALRNLVEAMPEDDRGKAWDMLAAFEAKASA